MDTQKPTLPHLLDIVIPVQPPEPTNRRPATAAHSTSNRFNFDDSNFPKSSKGRPFGQSQNSFRPKTQNDKKFEKEPPTFSFSSFRIPQKVLPKLYTGPQHECMSQKYKDLKDRYQRLYKKIEGAEDDQATNENLREIFLEAEKMFNVTYSVKYFGVQGDELGVASKRIPMHQANCQTPSGNQQTFRKECSLQEQKNIITEERKGVSRQGRRAQNLSVNSKAEKNIYNLQENDNQTGDVIVEESTRTIENEIKVSEVANSHSVTNNKPESAKKRVMSAKKGFYQNEQMAASAFNFRSYRGSSKNVSTDNINQEAELDELGIPEDTLEKDDDDDLLTARAMKSSMANHVTSRTLQTQGGPRSRLESGRPKLQIGGQNDYVVTKYLIPKKLQTAKKKAKALNATANQTQRLWGTKIQAQSNNPSTHRAMQVRDEEGLWPKSPIGVQQVNPLALKKATSLDQKIASMEKVKRSLLRNVHVEKAWEAKPYKDELDIPEKFRTYEVKKVMADRAKYSYAKLLETMNTSERPETALIESTEKMEKILSVREEKRKFLGSKSGRRTDDFGDADKRDANGNYVVKVCYPKENEMFNRFWKIKHTVVNEQEGYN